MKVVAIREKAIEKPMSSTNGHFSCASNRAVKPWEARNSFSDSAICL